MKLLFVDTETTGLPKNWKAPATDIDNWPRVVEFAAIKILMGSLFRENHESILKPDGFSIPSEASAVHGLTTEIATAEGADRDSELRALYEDMEKADFICGHNVDYDVNCLKAEFVRLELPLIDYKTLDTMKQTRSLFSKWPKLAELYLAVKGEPMIDAHRAAADIAATYECFLWLVAHGVIELPKMAEKQ